MPLEKNLHISLWDLHIAIGSAFLNEHVTARRAGNLSGAHQKMRGSMSSMPPCEGSSENSRLCAAPMPSWQLENDVEELPAQGCRNPAGVPTETPLSPLQLAEPRKCRLTRARHTCGYCLFIYCKAQVAALSCLSHCALWPVLHPLKMSQVCFGTGSFLAGAAPISTASN